MTVYATKLYRVTSEEFAIRTGTVVGEVVWCHGNRKSSLGGYIGRFCKTYPHKNKAGEIVGYSPRGTGEFTANMDALEEIPCDGPLKFSFA